MPRNNALGRDPLARVDPLDDLLPPRRPSRDEEPRPSPGPEPEPAPPAQPAKGRRRRRQPSPLRSTAGARGRLTVELPASVLEDARAAVYWSPGLTLAALAAEALRREIARLAALRGEPFPPAAGELPPGPPVGAR